MSSYSRLSTLVLAALAASAAQAAGTINLTPASSWGASNSV